MSKADLIALRDLHKQGDFFQSKAIKSEDITRRDIVEFVYANQLGFIIQQSAQELVNTPPHLTPKILEQNWKMFSWILIPLLMPCQSHRLKEGLLKLQ